MNKIFGKKNKATFITRILSIIKTHDGEFQGQEEAGCTQ